MLDGLRVFIINSLTNGFYITNLILYLIICFSQEFYSNMHKIVLSSLFCLTLATTVFPQRYNFKVYNVPEGLVHSVVSSICEDQNGFMWFGTYDGGISRFDGISFQNYTHNNGLPSNRIQVIYSDTNGILWIGTEDAGLVKYDGRKFVSYGTEEGLLSNTITSIVNDEQGKLWIGTSEGVNLFENDSLYAFDKNDHLKSTYVLSLMKTNENEVWIGTPRGIVTYNDGVIDSITVSDGLVNRYVKTMIQDSRGDVWIGTPRGVGRISSGEHTNFIQEGGQENNWVEGIGEDKIGQIWIGTRGGGVYVYNEGVFKHITDKNGLNSNTVLSITRGSTGVLWLGTVGGGVNKHTGDTFIHFGKEEGLSHDLVFSIIEDHKKNMWLGTYGGGVNKYNPSTGQIQSYDKEDGLSGDNVFSIMESSQGELWVGTMKGLSKFDGQRFQQHPKYEGIEIWSLFEDDDGSVWVGTQNGVVKEKNLGESMNKPASFWKNPNATSKNLSELSIYNDQYSSIYYSKADGFSNGIVNTITKDLEGNIWLGTDREGIFKFDGQQFKKYDIDSGLGSNYIMSVTTDEFGAIWFGTSKGLAVIVNDEVKLYTETDGLSCNTINSVIIDEQGSIWAGGTKGIDKIQFDADYKIIDVINYREQEGFVSIETNDGAGLKDSDGNLWFGTIKGATRVAPKSVLQAPHSTKVRISKIRLFFDDVDWSSFTDNTTPWFNLPIDLELENDQNQLTFDFIGINMKIPEKIQYQWKLDGFDKDWSPVTSKREANYTNIPPGDYTFIVRATNEVGIWSTIPANFSFKINSPFWQRWWFIFLSASLFILTVWGFISYRLKHIEKMALAQQEMLTIERRLIESERKALRAQINPHFIFNVLNSIQYYIQDNEPLVASRHLSKFAKLMRMILENSQSSAVPLSDELESLKLYMDLEILRTEYKFDYVINIDKAIDVNECMIPPMLIQPFIENSIRHGVIPSESSGRITLNLKLENDVIICAIEDNGVGINTAKKNKEDSDHISSGMQITGDRLEILNMQRSHKMDINIVDLEDEGNGLNGTRVEIFIPLEN